MTDPTAELTIHTDLARQILVEFLRAETRRAGFGRSVVGLSGGVDSALACYLAAEALGAEARFESWWAHHHLHNGAQRAEQG